MEAMQQFQQLDITGLSEDQLLNVIRTYKNELESRELMKPQGKFNNKRYNELLKNTPTKFITPFGEEIILRKELIKNLIISAKHLYQEFDLFMLFVGQEGAGKSLFVRQVNYAMWWIMKELDMINYPFNMDLVHFGIKDLQQDRKTWDEQGLKFRESILDESKDDIGRDKYKTPEANAFIDYIRRCREESGVISLLLPQVSEILPALVLSRVVMIFEVDFDTDDEGNIIRGDWKLVTIPRGKESYSLYHDKFLKRSYIKKVLSQFLYKTDEKYSSLPNSIVSFQGTFNRVDPVLSKEYKLKKRQKKWERYKGQDDDNAKQKIEDIPFVRKSLDYLKVIYQLHKSSGGKDKDIYEAAEINQRTFYRDKKLLSLTDN